MNSKFLTTSCKAGHSAPWCHVLSLSSLCSGLWPPWTLYCSSNTTSKFLLEANICWISKWPWVRKYKKQRFAERPTVALVISHMDSREVAETGFWEWGSAEEWNSPKARGYRADTCITSPLSFLSFILLKQKHCLSPPPYLVTLGSLPHQWFRQLCWHYEGICTVIPSWPWNLALRCCVAAQPHCDFLFFSQPLLSILCLFSMSFVIKDMIRRSNQSILKEINSEYSLKGLMLKLKLQYFGHLTWRADSLESWLIYWCWERLKEAGEGGDRGWDG